MKSRKKSDRRKSRNFSHLFLARGSITSPFAEAYRTLRTNIHFCFMKKDFQSLLITSAGPGEGKTTTGANLAYTMALAGKSVLMIDADLRRPMLGHISPSGTTPGLTRLLSDLFGAEIRNGSLEHLGVGDLFKLLSLQKRTGLLGLSDGRDKVTLRFLQGELVDLDWLTIPEEKKLAAVLVKNRLITKENADLALRRQKDTGQKLPFILINAGLLKEKELKGLLTLQNMEGLRIAFQFKAGKFYFKALSEFEFDRASIFPVDCHSLYKQVTAGDKGLPYLEKKIKSAILETGVTNLFVLPSRNPPPNPSELLGSERMSFLLSHLKKMFDVLVIDSSPILPASDALLLAPQTDGVLLVVKAGLMNRKMVINAAEQLRRSRANLLGVVLNHVDTKKEGYYKYYHGYHSKYYGAET